MIKLQMGDWLDANCPTAVVRGTKPSKPANREVVTLFEIESSEELDALQEAILSEIWDDTNIDGIWIGLNDVFHDGTWVWDHSGRPLEFSGFWAQGEPDNFGGAQHCGISLTNPKESTESRIGEWLDVSCEEKQLHLGTVCEGPGMIYFPLSVNIESLAGQRTFLEFMIQGKTLFLKF